MTTEEKKLGRREGWRRKDAAQSILAVRRAGYVRLARRALLLHALQHGVVTADDVRAAVDLPELDPRAFGAVPRELAMLGIIRADGYEKSCRPDAHCRPVTRWRLQSESMAKQWLVDHPAPRIATAAEMEAATTAAEATP